MSVGTLVFFYNYLRGRKSECLRIEIYLQPQEELGAERRDHKKLFFRHINPINLFFKIALLRCNSIT